MAGLQSGYDSHTPAQVAEIIAWHHADRTCGPEGWAEATMRRFEVPSVVDMAKRPDTGSRLSRLLGL